MEKQDRNICEGLFSPRKLPGYLEYNKELAKELYTLLYLVHDFRLNLD